MSKNLFKFLSFFNFYQASEVQSMVKVSELTMTHWIETTNEVGEVTSRWALPLTPLARIMLVAPAMIVVEFVIGFLRFKKIQFK